ncbi:MAG: segregation/condensation protein A [Synergistaceae bacterium]|jgi:segregation and condensation protein A|nr:segregation/condensation protein A [Synergistaceae bacterium]
MPDDSVFKITLQDFSGPLDLLCHLVESSAIEASSVKLTDVLSQYVSYLLSSKKTALAEIAEFFSLASRLLIRKVRSLLPRTAEEENSGADEEAFGEDRAEDRELSEETLAAMLERFKPYRLAAMRLDGMKRARERSFARIPDEGGPPWFDIGDLYSLSTLWWSLAEEYSRGRERASMAGFMEDIPDAVPQEVQVDRRMDDIRSLLAEAEKSTLSALLEHFGGGGLIVTLLALLELSRLGNLGMTQAEEWGDIEIETR